MRRSCRLLAWGLLLALFDFRIGGIDLLPDALGYLLALIGLSRFADRHPALRAGQFFAAGLLLLAVASFFGSRGISTPLGERDLLVTPARLSYSALAVALSLALTCCLCVGLGRLAETSGSRALGGQFQVLLIFSLLHGGLLLFLLPFGLNGYRDLTLGTALIGGALGIVLTISLIVLVRRAGRLPDIDAGDVHLS
ncbi:hypothetical protein [Cohnella sp. 56]|uniref:hypothetical protein n=1 Tax=Cohnella sp. 56 TaxID=3113722 RepID=UPI0030EA420E